MTIALWCVLLAGLLPIVCAGISKWGFRDFDNRNPREWLAKQQGWRARANAAQQNSWEAFALFAAGVFAAHLAGGPQALADGIAVVFLVTRMLYVFLYVTDRATLRSLAWLLGLGLTVALFLLNT